MIDGIPVVFLSVVLPLAGALLVSRASGARSARGHGGVVAGLTLLAWGALGHEVLAGPAVLLRDPPLVLGGPHHLFGLDALSALLAITTGTTTLAVVVGAPRARDERARITALLATEGLVLLMCASLDPIVLSLAFASLVLPAAARLRGARELSDTSRLYQVIVLGGAVPLAVALILAWGTGLEGASPTARHLAVGALVVAVAFRMGIFPFHSWMPALVQHGSFGSAVLIVASQSGPYLLVRLVFPSLVEDGGETLRWLGIAGCVSALYGGVLAVVEDDLRRILGWISVQQAGLMLVALTSLTPDGMAGAVVYWLSYGVAVTGLALCIWAVAARTGTTRISQLGGLVQSAPRLTVAFSAFAVASVGFPGSLGFVAEDLMVHGVLESDPVLGSLMVVATALSGVGLMRGLFRAFFGPCRVVAPADLLGRELWVAVALAGLAFGLGAWPRALVDTISLARLGHP